MLYRAAIVLVGAGCGGYNSVVSGKSESVREEREERLQDGHGTGGESETRMGRGRS